MLDRAYLDRCTNHERAALDLHLSRATYFRLLRQAVSRLAEHLIAEAAFGTPLVTERPARIRAVATG